MALAIFAIIAGFAYRGLDAMLESREALEKRIAQVARRRALRGPRSSATSARCSTAHGDRPVGHARSRRVSSVARVTPSARDGLALTRSGSPLQENALAAPQRIAYRLRDGRVERLSWAGVDAAPRDEPAAVTVLAAARARSPSASSTRSGEWRATWGRRAAATRLPAAVEMTLELASGERIVRLVDLPRTP